MKKLLLYILLLSTINARSQMIKLFQDAPFEQRQLFIDSIKMELPSSFALNDSLVRDNMYIYDFADSSKHDINVKYYEVMKGANKDLRIAGTSVISGGEVKGPYLELYAIWKKYFDPQADLLKIQKDGRARLGEIRFHTYASDWWIIHY